ncbi:MAG TPA: GYF domain-containing protein [Polyangiaceae bacterium]|nr:GYF domain-containing protein [Polyangiaceae bacterium]
MTDADSLDHGWGSGSNAGPSPASVWQVNTRGRKVVEMTLAELSGSVKSSKVTRRSLVWTEGMAEWTPLEDVMALAKLLRDSEPPPSGTRPRLDELTSGGAPYGSVSDSTTNTDALAVYERPLATIEFPEAIEAAEPADEPTPAVITPSRNVAINPGPAAGRSPSTPVAASPAPEIERDEPDLPPLPSIRATLPGPLFLPPVTASPLGAALSTAVDPAKAGPPRPAPRPAAPPMLERATAAGTATPSAAVSATAVTTDTPSATKRPRPAIEFLPPIIVHEKEEDDGASAILELPLHGAFQRPKLREAPFSESTLVLSGRKRARWVPLNAAIALGVGAACLASALTAVAVRSHPTPPARVVEKPVAAPAVAQASTPTATKTAIPEPVAHPEIAAKPAVAGAPRAETARSSSEPRADAPRAGDGPRTATSESRPPKSDVNKSDSGAATPRPRESWRDDPGSLEDSKPSPRREARAGFPTNPGF